MPYSMNANRKAWWHLATVSTLLLVADQLPDWHKLWFVSETGHFHTTYTITAVLVLGLFLRWRPALGLLVAWQVLHLFLIYFALSHDLSGGEYTFGYLLLAFLRLAALCILFFSADINRYVRRQPIALAS
ncbi:hypothetical protein [Hymenobacter sp. GOD-10R]|uniref:hypothetical protein n=1 Tax=Hymenobacter sp. GOD-10R TaxID=3093922 RepID=UPI002D78C257|nr:hypothetical protein [Hymenobacter sp. GOD-10R]WRQ29287.1 hypothetical protein SD425_03300 [Hymenobacter sp. GOD-10R]